jgi:hypothetical protein
MLDLNLLARFFGVNKTFFFRYANDEHHQETS